MKLTQFTYTSWNKGLFLKRSLRLPPLIKISSRLSVVVLLMGVLLGAFLIYRYLLQSPNAQAAWFDDTYRYRQRVSISNANSAELSDFQVQIVIDTASLISAGKMQSDCDDIRFVSTSGENLAFFQTTACNATVTRYWVKVTRIPPGASNIYMYYGNSTASSASNRDATFDVSLMGTYIGDFYHANIAPNHGLSSDRVNNFYTSDVAIVNRFNSSWVYQQQFASPEIYTGLCYDDKNNRFYGIDWTNKQWSTFSTSFVEIAPMDQSLGDQPIDCATDSTYIYTNHRNGLIKRNAIANNATSSINMDSLAGGDWGGQGITYAYGYLIVGSSFQYGDFEEIIFLDITDWSNPKIVKRLEASTNVLSEVSGLTWKDKSIFQTSRFEDYAIEYQGPVKTSANEPVVTLSNTEEIGPGPIAHWKFDEGYGSVVNDSARKNIGGLLPFTQRGSVLEASDAADSDQFGISTALSADGTVLAVGAEFWTGAIPYQGGVYVYDWNGASWVQRGSVLEASDAADLDFFGTSTALSADGTVLAVGARGWEDPTGVNRGGLYVFDWNGASWVQRGSVLEASDAANGDFFGSSTALSADGTVLTVGARLWESAGIQRGGLYVYDWNGASWVQRGSVLEASDAADNDFFGTSTALSADGTVLAVGARGWEGATGTDRGGVYVYDWNGTSWVQRGSVLEASDAADSDQFGTSTALSADGKVLTVGAQAWEGATGSNRGGLYVFDWNGASWVQRGSVLEASDAADSDYFGSSTALSADGMVLTVGASLWEGAKGYDRGGLYVYDLSGPTWQSEDMCIDGKCLYFDGVNDRLSMGNPTDLQITGDISVSAWIKPKQPESQGVIIHKNSQYTLIMKSDKKVSWADSSNWSYASFGDHDIGIESGKWNHIAVTKTSGVVKIYRNGEERLSKSFGGDISANSNNMFLGCYANATDCTGNYFAGFIDEVKVFPRALSAQEIKTNYIRGASSTGSSVVLGADDINLSNGLVGYWKMDEESWTGNAGEVIDSSGNNKNGTSQSASITNGKYSNAGDFTGGSITVDDSTNSNLDLTDQVTLSAWVYNNGSSGLVRGIIQKGRIGAFGSDYGRYAMLIDSNDKLALYINGFGASVTSINSVPSNQWSHVVGVYNKSKLVLYINGALEGVSTDYSENIGTDDFPLLIGTSGNVTLSTFNGSIDDLRIYNRALSDREVKALYNWAPGPVAYWNFDENAGTTANDTSGNGNSGTLTNGTTWTQGKYGSALSFDGVNDYLASPFLQTNFKGISAGMWINTLSPQAELIYQFGGSGIWIGRFTQGKILAFADGSSSNNTSQDESSTVVGNGQWHYVAMSNDGTTTKLYINGILEKQYAESLVITANNLILGSNVGASAFYAGLIDDVRIYNYARTQEQILQDMQGGTSAVLEYLNEDLSVLNLKFDEGYGQTVNDSSSQGINGTLGTGNSAPSWTNDGKFGKALSFDGVGDRVSITTNSAQRTQVRSKSFWIKPTAYNAAVYSYISTNDAVGMDQSNGSHRRTQVYLNSQGKLVAVQLTYSCSVGGGSFSEASTTNTSIQTVPLNQWTHIALVFDFGSEGVMKNSLYLNGVLDNTVTRTNTVCTGADHRYFMLGWRKWTSPNDFSGVIDEVKLYPFALTADQIKLDMNQSKAMVLGAGSTGVGGTTPSNSASREYCVPGDMSACSAPIAEWKLDEKTGTTANDTSGNGNTGTFSGDVSWTTGIHGAGVSLGGASDNIDVGDIAAVDTADITISFWARVTDLANDSVFISKGAHTTNQPIVVWFDKTVGSSDVGSGNTDSISVLTYDGSVQHWVAAPSNTLTDSNWHYYSIVLDNTNNVTSIYKDGQRVVHNTKTWNGIQASANTIKIGGSTSGTSDLEGSMDEVRIYNYVRSHAQISWEYNRGAPVAHYKFDECQGATVFNSALNADGTAAGNDGTFTVGSSGSNTSIGTCVTSGARANGAIGKYNASLDFDGVNDLVTLTSSYDQRERFTISLWAKSADFTPSMYLYEVVYGRPAIYVSGDDIRVALRDAADTTWNAYGSNNDTLEDNKWNHILVTYDNPTIRIYHNGKLDYEASHTGPIGGWNSGLDTWFGGRSTVWFNGQLDDIRIYNYPMTAEQVKINYNNGAVSLR